MRGEVKEMARPKCCRRIHGEPNCKIFKPVGVPVSSLEEVVLSMDEFEAIRLADLEQLYHEQAAEKMKVSRQTFGRILESARCKVAKVLAEGLALRIEGGEVEMTEKRTLKCQQCLHTWDVSYGMGRPAECPACKSSNLSGSGEQRGAGNAGGRCRWVSRTKDSRMDTR
jgi:predicted DNA-binding protein (UPF0251 family)